MWHANFLPIDHVSISPIDGIGPTQRERKSLTIVGIELGVITAVPPSELRLTDQEF